MLKITNDLQGLDLTFQLDERQTSIMASVVRQEWFDILQRMMEQEVKMLNIRLINTETSNPQEILSNHAVAKGAGMFYIGFIQRLEQLLREHEYMIQGVGTAGNPEQPPYQQEFVAAPTNDEVS